MTGFAEMRVAIVCPYDLERPGGVQQHVLLLAEALRAM
ncbi:MAG: phosphatidylinositol alpha-mannosyltransferase, partial [Myxococcota bacterium]